MFDYIRVASAVPKISVGNTEFNTNEIIKKISLKISEVNDSYFTVIKAEHSFV